MRNLIPGKVARAELGSPGRCLSQWRYNILLAASDQKGFRYVDLQKLKRVNVPETFLMARRKSRATLARIDCPQCGKNVSVLNGHPHAHKRIGKNGELEKCH